MKKIIWVIVIVVIIGLFVWSGRKKEGTTPTGTAEPLKIGAILPLTGPIANGGEFARHGAELALEDVNKDGEKVQVFFEDYQYDAKQAVGTYNKLRDTDGVNAIFAFGTPAGMPLSPVANQAKVPLLTILAGTSYSTPNDYTYRVVGSGKTDAKAAVDVLVDKLGKKKIAVVSLNNDYGSGTLEEFKKLIVGKAEVVAAESAAPGVTDYRTQLTKVKAANPDAIFLPTLYKEGGTIIKQAKEMGINATFMCGQPCENPEFLAAAGAAAEGAFVMTPTNQDTYGFGTRYQERYGIPPSYIALRSYDAIKMLAAAAEGCREGNYAGECLKMKLDSLRNFPGLSFPITFDENGDITDMFSIKVVRDGKFVPYE